MSFHNDAYSRLRDNQAFLTLLTSASPIQRNQLIRTASKDQLESICECAHNIFRRNVALSPSELSNIRKHREIVYKVASKNVSLPRKRAILEQSGGFLPALLAPIIGTIIGAVADTVIRKYT